MRYRTQPGPGPNHCSGGCRHCPAVRSVLKCPNGSERKENGIGGASRIVTADSVGGRISRSAAASGAWGAHAPQPGRRRCASRSEEHTSELQAHLNLGCPLLLGKKKKKTTC